MFSSTLAPTLKPFRKQTKSIAIEPQQLNQVAATTAKNKDISREWLLLQRHLQPRPQGENATPNKLRLYGQDRTLTLHRLCDVFLQLNKDDCSCRHGAAGCRSVCCPRRSQAYGEETQAEACRSPGSGHGDKLG
jgi:hypothetical protein